MLTAISRYGARVLPNTQQLIAACKARGEFVQGPQIEQFERAFEQRVGSGRAVSTSLGRMAFHYILKALGLPAGSEIVFPAMTFWVMPEIAQSLGLKVVFADVNPRTFLLDPENLERAVTPRTRAVVPTHLFGLPCDMDEITDIARRRHLVVIEDCAHALGATYKGRQIGTFGVAAEFSFQTLKPLNTYGGGMALVNDDGLAERVAALAAAESWPSEKQVSKKLFSGRVQRIFIRPNVFTWTLFPVLRAWRAWANSDSDVYMWETVRPLSPLPADYTVRYSNVQAVLGLEALKHLDTWTCATQANARLMNECLAGVPGVDVPFVPGDRTHVYYQYLLQVACDRDGLVKRALRERVDLEMRHVDVCTERDIFAAAKVDTPNAARAARGVQAPVYYGLTQEQVRRVADVIRRVVGELGVPQHAPAGVA